MALTPAQIAQVLAQAGNKPLATTPLSQAQMLAAIQQGSTGRAANPLTSQQMADAINQVHNPGPRRLPGTSPLAVDGSAFVHPGYSGTDAQYAAWLAGADLQAADAQAQARFRRKQAEDAYMRQLQDLELQGTTGRRNIQTSMLQRGVLASGETTRRQSEFDSAMTQAQQRALAGETDAFGQADAAKQTALTNLSVQGATQVSQAMLRDSLAAYNAQQQAAAAAAPPAPVYQPATAPAAQPTYTPTVPAQPTYNPVTNSSSLYKAQSLPKPAAKPKMQQTKLVLKGLQ